MSQFSNARIVSCLFLTGSRDFSRLSDSIVVTFFAIAIFLLYATYYLRLNGRENARVFIAYAPSDKLIKTLLERGTLTAVVSSIQGEPILWQFHSE